MALPELRPNISSQKEGRFDNNTLLGPERVYISPLLGDLQLSDFPDGYRFGNNTTGSLVPLKRRQADGSVKLSMELLAWTVFPYETRLSPTELYRMREIFEGLPPGSPDRNTWRPFNRKGALRADLAAALYAELQTKPVLTEYEKRWMNELPSLIVEADDPPPVLAPRFAWGTATQEQRMEEIRQRLSIG